MIEIKDLTVSFGNNTVISSLSLNLGEGVCCVYAPSGGGKTTLLNAIAHLVPFSGEIKAEGKMCYVFQEDTLLPWLTARENIMLSAENKASADYYIEKLGINAFSDKRPHEMSGGMKRRTAVARGLSFGGDFFLFDEPFAGLDDKNKLIMCGEIKKLKGTVIVVTHDSDDTALLNAKRVDLA